MKEIVKSILIILCLHFYSYSQFSGGSGSGYSSIFSILTNCPLFSGDSCSGFSTDSVYLTAATCPQYMGDSMSGYSSFVDVNTNCPLFSGDSCSGYNSDSVYLTFSTCPQYMGDSMSGYSSFVDVNTNCPNYFGNISSGYSSDFITCIPLPVIKFPLIANYVSEDEVRLEWELYGFDYNIIKQFSIMRKLDDDSWDVVAVVPNNQWEYIDDLALYDYEFVIYKIKATEINGTEHYSNIVLLRPSEKIQVLLYPNPVAQGRTIYIQHNLEERVIIEIISMSGQQVYKGVHYDRVISINMDYPAGLYIVRVYTGKYYNNFKVIVVNN